MRRGFYIALLWIALAAAPALAEEVCTIRIDGAIGPATAGYISRAIAEASSRNAQCLIIGLDTPGGLLDSTKDIVRAMLASEVPVVVYVSPSGAGATSAGCFVTLAADVAAMAPATTIGAAHPVSVGGGSEEQLGNTMKPKLENYSVSYIEAIAARRQRNVEWAKSSVKDSVSITSEKANLILQEIIDRHTDPWGIKVVSVEVRDVVLPDSMKRAMAKQAETERERRAKVINAEGEYQAAEKLVMAAAEIAKQPIALQLRYLQTVAEMASEHNTTTILPLPIELFSPFLKPQAPALPAEQ